MLREGLVDPDRHEPGQGLLEVAPTIRVNCVCQGIVNTEMMDREYVWEEEMTGEKQESIKERWMSGIPMGRFQEPEHVAGGVSCRGTPAGRRFLN
jgi:NAD(P)-dependent dehydrogenase (short-subunit alcohol dehydrogenase family)